MKYPIKNILISLKWFLSFKVVLFAHTCSGARFYFWKFYFIQLFDAILHLLVEPCLEIIILA